MKWRVPLFNLSFEIIYACRRKSAIDVAGKWEEANRVKAEEMIFSALIDDAIVIAEQLRMIYSEVHRLMFNESARARNGCKFSTLIFAAWNLFGARTSSSRAKWNTHKHYGWRTHSHLLRLKLLTPLRYYCFSSFTRALPGKTKFLAPSWEYKAAEKGVITPRASLLTPLPVYGLVTFSSPGDIFLFIKRRLPTFIAP